MLPHFAEPHEYILKCISLDIGKRVDNVIEKLWLNTTPGYGIKFYNEFRGIGFYDKSTEMENNKYQTKQDRETLVLVKAGKLSRCFEIENTLQIREAVKRGIAIFYDKDPKKNRTIREVLRDRIALTYIKNVFQRLSDPVNIKALEAKIYNFAAYHEDMIAAGVSFQQSQLFLAHSIQVQQNGSLWLKEIADSYSTYVRQYRNYYYGRIEAIASKVKGKKLSEFFAYCREQVDEYKVLRPHGILTTKQ